MTPLRLLVLVGLLGATTLAQKGPLVMAIGAPNCTGSDPTCASSPNYTKFQNFGTYMLPSLSGVVFTIPWSSIDNCTDTMSNPIECTYNPAYTCPESATDYKFCAIDNGLLAYIQHSSTSFANKKIALVIAPITEPPVNTSTPPYIFSSAWASGHSANLQDMVVCGAYPGDINNTSSCPVRLTASTFMPGDFGIWNLGATNCQNFGTVSCPGSCTTATTDISGFPVVYEKTFMAGYEDFLTVVAQHYNTNSPNNGALISPYIAYVRVGMSNGGENQPFCATQGYLTPDASRAPNSAVQAGFIVDLSNTLYVATGAGISGPDASIPTCPLPGCTSGPDGSIPGWYNAGPYSTSAINNAIWPGPAGEFGPGAEQLGYKDNGYLTTWENVGDGAGYATRMILFLKSLNASFPFTISAHNGPPNNAAVAYADSEAIIASANGVGFGMQSLSVSDSKTNAAGLGVNFPTSASDWVYNFKTYPAPVHHLQTFFPGSTAHAAGYPISSFSVDATNKIVTIVCYADCSPFAGDFIYISGSPINAFNGVWQACPSGVTTPCVSSGTSNVLEFNVPTSFPLATNTYSVGGIVWAPDYWPIILPFAAQHGATTVELYECDLDYAFGAWSSATQFLTTDWEPVGSSFGCLIPAGSPLSPVNHSPSDLDYLNAMNSLFTGQPVPTALRTGNNILVNGTQY
jgi:hypothetical protein